MDDLISSTSSSTSDRLGWLDVNAFNLEVERNKVRNHTENYKWQNNKKLVVRRGIGFTIHLSTSKPFNLRAHAIIFIFNIGTGRSQPNATQQIQVLPKIAMEQSQFGTDWAAEILESDENSVAVEIHIPIKCIIGCWRVRIFSGSSDENEQISNVHECSVSKFQKLDVYVLFNPYLEADPSFYENACERAFYLNQQTELSFSGTKVGPNSYNFSKNPWVHGQFDENTLKTAVFLLEKMTKDEKKPKTTGITVNDRMNVVRVIRKMAFAVKTIFFMTADAEIDDTNFISTKQLIDKFIESQRSLISTESFVQANLYISLIRSLGICARSVTCIEASYDADPTLTVDRAFVKNSDDFTFEPMRNSVGQLWECTRTYHIWVECFCRRSDIGSEFDGWQLVDPTAPESPLSARQFGPASLRSLKATKLEVPYDARLFYGMYRSNKVQWFYEYESEADEYRLLHVKFCWGNEL
ncbi:unnamed protein product [Bursaphelenchus xylophilus]|uniref:(pine wood nematode) hypothetical protein n=1 Tax=Bursaphelenchus xylophilus TaxID=6326 RepID=A0A1I7S1A3_BURXY|nr:unnamed protein product [Bursaphelenchus xylophilus]CAG9080184.1 unnamed protein product [Bursaphelenchus xylophilus]